MTKKQLKKELRDSDWLTSRMSKLLTLTANALKGDPGDLKLHDWSDLPEVASKIAEESRRYREASGTPPYKCPKCGKGFWTNWGENEVCMDCWRLEQ